MTCNSVTSGAFDNFIRNDDVGLLVRNDRLRIRVEPVDHRREASADSKEKPSRVRPVKPPRRSRIPRSVPRPLTFQLELNSRTPNVAAPSGRRQYRMPYRSSGEGAAAAELTSTGVMARAGEARVATREVGELDWRVEEPTMVVVVVVTG